MSKFNPDDILGEVLIDEVSLSKRVQELGKQISEDYAGKNLHLICILRGGVVFLTDLMRAITTEHTIDFMAVSSYGKGARSSSGQVRLTMDLKEDISGRDVILVEDIIDSGHTLSNVLEILHTREPASLKVCTLLDKAERREVDIDLEYVGFVIPDKFVVGYGLDVDEYMRNLPYIGVVKDGAFIED